MYALEQPRRGSPWRKKSKVSQATQSLDLYGVFIGDSIKKSAIKSTIKLFPKSSS